MTLSKNQACERNAAHSNSGLSVDHSDPGLKGPTLPATSGRTPEAREIALQGCLQSPAGTLQPKSGRGFGGSAPNSAEGAANSFIDKRVTVPGINTARERDKAEKWERRKKGCGAWTFLGRDAEGNGMYLRAKCKTWGCAYCGPRRARRYMHAIRVQAERHGLRVFLTLTLDPKKLNGEDSTKYLNRCFAELRKRMFRMYGHAPKYIRILEYQKNGTAHFHVLFDRYVEIEWLRRVWQEVGGGWMVYAQFVDVHRVGAYLTKYLTKDMLMSAPKGTRRVTCSQAIKIFEKQASDKTWCLLRTTLEHLRSRTAFVTREIFDGGILQGFEVATCEMP